MSGITGGVAQPRDSPVASPIAGRRMGLLLIVYGIVGLALVVGGAFLVVGSVRNLDSLTSVLETERTVLVESLAATSTFLGDAEDGTVHVGTSLSTSVDAARRTATLTRSLATTMTQLSNASTISILGNQPFASLTGGFATVGQQASSLGAALDQTADSLAQNSSDLSTIHTDLAAVRSQVDSLRGELSTAIDLGAIETALDTSRVVLLGLVGWLALQAVGAIAIGILLVRRRHPQAIELIQS